MNNFPIDIPSCAWERQVGDLIACDECGELFKDDDVVEWGVVLGCKPCVTVWRRPCPGTP